MSDNRSFWKALHSLTHPLSIACILLLLLNDHWLRHNYPSWLSGKLGDFTWLLFAPFITAMLFALIIPRKTENRSNIIGIASIAFIGLWFATAKTIPAIHWLTTETLYAIVGYRGTLRMDVTDLLTLPALFLSWHIWQTSATTKVNLKPVAYVAFGLAMLGTMASDGLYYEYIYDSTSIEVICELTDGRLLTTFGHEVEIYGYGETSESIYSTDPASENFPTAGSPIIGGIHHPPEEHNYVSYNGGLSWIAIEGTFGEERCSSPDEQVAINPTNEQIRYRWEQGRFVEQSLDSGETWTRLHNLGELRQEVRLNGNHNSYYSINSPEPPYLQSPVSGLVHSETGNLVLAMSLDGVLVISPDGGSDWVGVGEYQLDNLQDLDFIQGALIIHYLLLPTLMFLILVTTIAIIHARMWFTRSWLIAGWIHWIILVFSVTFDDAKIDHTYTVMIWGSALFSLVFIAIPMIIWALWNLIAHYRPAIIPILVAVFLVSAGYLFPLILWTQGLIPRYYVASSFSILLTGCILWACYVHFKDKLPARYEPPKEKRKPKEV